MLTKLLTLINIGVIIASSGLNLAKDSWPQIEIPLNSALILDQYEVIKSSGIEEVKNRKPTLKHSGKFYNVFLDSDKNRLRMDSGYI